MKRKASRIPIIDRHTKERYGRINVRHVDDWIENFLSDEEIESRFSKYFIPLDEKICKILSERIGRKVVEAYTDNWKIVVILEKGRPMKKNKKEYGVYQSGSNKQIGDAELPHSLVLALDVAAKPLEVSTENPEDCQIFSQKFNKDFDLVLFDVKEEKIWVRTVTKKK